MRWRDLSVTFELFIRASSMHRKRALLTVAAIAWGTVAILMLLSFGEGLKRQLLKSRRGMGENIAVWWPGETSKVWQGLPAGRPIRPRIDDIPALRQQMPSATSVVGEIHAWGTTLTRGRTTITGRVVGAHWQYGELRHHYPSPGGRFLNANDERHKKRVIFLGDALAEDLFGDDEPVGRTVQVAGAPYLVIGVMQHKLQMGNYGGMDADHALIPITTFAAQFGRQTLGMVVFGVEAAAHMPVARREFAEALSARFRFDPTDEQVTNLWDTARGTEIMANMMIGIQAFLGIVGGLTLLIGGIGVANIMYAVVKERTREFGVKMALGARPSWITGPIVLEGLVYTLTGGLIGVLMAVGCIVLLGLIPTEGNEVMTLMGKPALSPGIGFGAAAVLGLIGLFSGYLPARRAATIDPAETLRYE